ncbi:MAG: hypothetical protein FJY29_02870 [Betaproteobacteria bacterium]|nr:hypothetical protein [Betaproteobacteria bacterium]
MGVRSSLFRGLGFCIVILCGCWPQNNKSQDSELDAITAASKRLFGQNVRGYMWALTTDSPAVFAQAPVGLKVDSSPGVVFYDPFAVPNTLPDADVPQRAAAPANRKPTGLPGLAAGSKEGSASSVNPFAAEYFQCWYYAETEVYEKLEGDALKKLFLNKTKTKRVNNTFLDVKHLYKDLERTEALKHLESFALSALPGTCFLLNSIGPLRGKAKGALSSAFCSVSLASLATTRKPSGDGWGSDKARQHIQNQLKAKVNELDEVNWDVLWQLKTKVAEFNSASKHSETTQVQCPANEQWVSTLMGSPKN